MRTYGLEPPFLKAVSKSLKIGYCQSPPPHHLHKPFKILRKQFAGTQTLLLIFTSMDEVYMGNRTGVQRNQNFEIFGTSNTLMYINFKIKGADNLHIFISTSIYPKLYVCLDDEEKILQRVLPPSILFPRTYWVMLSLCWVMTKAENPMPLLCWYPVKAEALWSGLIWIEWWIGTCWCRKSQKDQTQVWSQLEWSH